MLVVAVIVDVRRLTIATKTEGILKTLLRLQQVLPITDFLLSTISRGQVSLGNTRCPNNLRRTLRRQSESHLLVLLTRMAMDTIRIIACYLKIYTRATSL
jgi:hypothetical protein